MPPPSANRNRRLGLRPQLANRLEVGSDGGLDLTKEGPPFFIARHGRSERLQLLSEAVRFRFHSLQQEWQRDVVQSGMVGIRPEIHSDSAVIQQRKQLADQLALAGSQSTDTSFARGVASGRPGPALTSVLEEAAMQANQGCVQGLSGTHRVGPCFRSENGLG